MADSRVPIGARNYLTFADRYAALAPTKAHNALYERPAMQSLLPDVKGLRVLDAGCGPGLYCEWLAQQGASVTGVDVVERMVELARERTRGLKVELRVANLEEPLDWLADASFNIVVAPLVLDNILDWRGLLGEFHRVLVNDGLLVFSIQHPAFTWINFHPGRECYLSTELASFYFTGFGEPHHYVEYYRRPLDEAFNSVIESGFRVDRVLEPRPLPEMEQSDPWLFRRLNRTPSFLCIRAIRA
ncbi:MAG TPA: methyltransferase domain-containing protein [Candidatus Angelobacter sp.]|nr:methyltransferase domain-containing protein [Candidatus Angelobacter sp.]